MIAFPLDDAWLKGPLHVGLFGKRSAILWAMLEGVNLSYKNLPGRRRVQKETFFRYIGLWWLLVG